MLALKVSKYLAGGLNSKLFIEDYHDKWVSAFLSQVTTYYAIMALHHMPINIDVESIASIIAALLV